MKKINLLLILVLFQSCLQFGAKKSALQLSSLQNPPLRQPDSLPEPEVTNVSFVPRVGDRHYVANTLVEIFGPEVQTIVFNYIESKIGYFGGAADIYTASMGNINEFEYGSQAIIMNEDRANHIPDSLVPPTVIREGLQIRACAEIFKQKPDNVQSVFTRLQIDLKKSLDSVGLNKLYQEFYPIEELDEETLQLLKSLESDLGSSNAWKKVLLTFCVSPQWKLL